MPDDERERLVRHHAAPRHPDHRGRRLRRARVRRLAAAAAARVRRAERGQPRRARQLGVARRSRPAIASAGSPAAAGTIRSCGSSTASRSRARRCSGMAVAEFLASRRLRSPPAPAARRARRQRRALPRGDRDASSPRARACRRRAAASCCGSSCRRASMRSRSTSRRCASGIVVAPGPLFSARQRFANFIRISAGTPWSERDRRRHAHARAADRAGIARLAPTPGGVLRMATGRDRVVGPAERTAG